MELILFTDGGCTPNPGAMSIGVVAMQDGRVLHTISKRFGIGTSNIAELLAIKEALLWTPRDAVITLTVDSKYAEGLVSKGWTPTKNIQLVQEVRSLFKSFPHIRMERVRGHQGNQGNELADRLAQRA